MKYDITPQKVAGVAHEANQALRNKGFNSAEVVLGLQELVGRIIVDMCATPVSADALVQHTKQHLDDTVRIGFQSKEQSPILRV